MHQIKCSTFSDWPDIYKRITFSISVSLVLMQVSRNYTDVFLAHWVTSQSAGGFDNATVTKYLSIYGGIAAVNAVFSFLRWFSVTRFDYNGV